ncbi:hypothetical protein KSD_57090 [Ktedonobacter sp. SOSP1-85]|uniref:hypothetical protein n=1 Tax=Ktedonobacter sp. SOSP1-85 TaxID=2778367 RepID=UPI0019154BA0|nr:hypothetical protein [Ktedonobacter sp. SOSP1-85]GHO77938.1 hypothetical protein KSD_57090 [Ktedonobacter sp. SOSP1-85]
MDEELLEGAFKFGRFVVGGLLRIVGNGVSNGSEHLADLAANTMDTFEIPGSGLVRDHAHGPLNVVGMGLDKLGEFIMEEHE